ncbi:MAG: serine kinase [Firmicutes bacterium]|nr:serine kinase [Bacillota bacterium]
MSNLRLAAIVEALSLTPNADYPHDVVVHGGYCSDLLSDVMGRATAGCVWVTNQVHVNVVAVASLVEAAAVIIAGGVCPESQTLEKAAATHVPLFTSDLSAFEVVGLLYEMGVKGAVRGG